MVIKQWKSIGRQESGRWRKDWTGLIDEQQATGRLLADIFDILGGAVYLGIANIRCTVDVDPVLADDAPRKQKVLE